MRRLVLIVHTSLNGYVAGPQGELSDFDPGEANLAFVASLTDTADAAMFGRVSFELLEAHWPFVKDQPDASPAAKKYSSWYATAQKIIISKTLDIQGPSISIIRENLKDSIEKIKASSGKDILIFGSPSLAQHLMEENLIDQYWIFINPVILGKGIQLYPKGSDLKKFTLVKQEVFPNGEIALCYEKK
jgi:dihydrofolate reductase